ncbi:hypothetical protein ASPFODRAFT_222566 [Aspergillus luchuensis CBS 106.47]|uniref:NAD-dependent epimerase/dehydratase domain-containing protein n=1 Tax=Aspergillus luchuensis (strain CBS 106.47) TaxID=1137211 RepID=A0A1M3T5R0_ASPLC|nr:hypothetical protein ASPFODRAFT_222566 [Aspergillus luchuensis CBS 106.47]
MTGKLYALPEGSRILVTGGNGFVGSNVIHALLELGFKVRATIRSPKPWLDQMFQEQFGEDSFQSVVFADYHDLDGLVGIMDGVTGVAHLVSDVSFGADTETIIRWVVKATQTILKAASKQPAIRRVVLTSSGVAVSVHEPNKAIAVDESTWNEAAVLAARNPNTPKEAKGWFGYCASKTKAEQAAWQWVMENNPQFQFNTVLPCFTIGRVLHKEIHGSTMGWVRGLLSGSREIFDIYIPQHVVDVIDIARLHAVALLDSNTKSQRIFGFAHSLNLTQMISTLRRLRPDNALIPNSPEGEGHDLTDFVPAKKAEKLIREFYGQERWTSVEDSIAEGIKGC